MLALIFLISLFTSSISLAEPGDGLPYFSYVNPQAPKGGELHVPTLKKFDSFFPFNIHGYSVEGSDLIFATLMKAPLTDLSNSHPYVALECSPAPDFSSVTFTLNPKAVFQDGSAIRAEDVKFSAELISQKSVTHGMFLKNIKSISVLSDQKVKFSFAIPTASFVKVLGTLPVFSKADYERNFSQKKPFFVPLSSGPYKIYSYKRPHFVVYKRIKNWWGYECPVNKGFYNFDVVKFSYYANTQAAFEAFKKKDVHIWVDQRISNWLKNYNFSAVKNGNVKKVEYEKPFPHGLTALFFNTRRWPYDDARIRQALSLMLNFDWINKVYFHNKYVQITSIFTNSIYGDPHGSHKKMPSYSDCKKKALALLEEAGFIYDKKKKLLLHKRKQKSVSLEFVCFSAGHAKIFQHYIASLKKIGIDAKLVVAAPATYAQKKEQFDFDLILNYQPYILEPGVEQIQLWSGENAFDMGSPNLAGVHDQDIDKIVQRIASFEKGDLKREKLLKEARQLNKLILSRYYVVLLWTAKTINVSFWKDFEYPTFSGPKDQGHSFLDMSFEGHKSKADNKRLENIRKGAAVYSSSTWWKN